LGNDSYPVVYDLQAPADQAKVREIYGNQEKWEYAKVTAPDETLVKRALELQYGDMGTSLFLAADILQAIIEHPVLAKFREAAEMPGMTPSAIETYGNALLRNNTDFVHRFSEFRTEMEKIAALGGMNPSEPKLQVMMQKIDQLPANFGKDALFEAVRLAIAEPKATMKP
jgi:hypothetical protein